MAKGPGSRPGDATDASQDETSMSTLRTAADVFVSPSRGLASAADARSIVAPLVSATIISILVTLLFVPRVDFGKTISDSLDRKPETAAQMTPHQREEAVTQGAKVGRVLAYAAGVLVPAGTALIVAFFLFVAFRVAGAQPPFAPTLAVAIWGLLPGYVKAILGIPAILRQGTIDPRTAERLLPTNPAAFFPAEATGVHVRLLSALDLFTLWSLALVILGTAHVAQVSKARAATVVVVLWLAWVAISKVALGGMAS